MIWVLGFIIGICLGSLTKLIADRSLTDKSFWGRSYCESCKKKLKWYDLFPILSFVFLQGKCRYCKKKLSIEYPLVEIAVGILTALVFGRFFPTNFLEFAPIDQALVISVIAFYSFIIVVLSSVFLTDYKTGYIPDRITYPAIWITFIYLLTLTVAKGYLLYDALRQSPIGQYLLPPHSNYFYTQLLRLAEPLFYGTLMALILGVFFYLLIVITRGKGMGGGDLKLAVFLGLALGFPYSLVAMMAAFLLGSVFGIGAILLKRKKFGQTIPFGPFLSIGGIITIFLGGQILGWYLTLSI